MKQVNLAKRGGRRVDTQSHGLNMTFEDDLVNHINHR